MSEYTPNLGLEKIDSGSKPWYEKYWATLDILDRLVQLADLVQPFVLTGFTASLVGTAPTEVTISAGVAYNQGRTVTPADTNLAVTNTGVAHTEYVSINTSGQLVISTATRTNDLLPIADVEVDENGVATSVTDVRKLFNGGNGAVTNISPTPTANTIPVLNSSGQLALPFTQTPILVGDQNLMNRTFYVDAVNGDDNNPGTSDAPFKSLNKAINSVPIGGYVYIKLLNDYQHNVSWGKISVNGKIVWINGYRSDGQNDSKYKLIFSIAPQGNYNTVYGFAYGGTVKLSYCDISFIDNSDSSLPYDTYTQVFDYRECALHWFVYLDRCKVTLPDNSNVQFIRSNGAGIHNVGIGFYETEIYSAGSNSYFIKISDSTIRLNDYSASLTGAKTSWNDLILGLVKDSNGVPRNVLSNIIL